MKKSHLIFALLAAGLLTGCAPQQINHKQSSSHQPTSSRKHKPSKSSHESRPSQSSPERHEKVAETPWTEAKSAKLASFMQTWGQSMGQQYESYSPGHSVNFYGVQIPDGLGGMPPAMNDQLLNYEWAPTGETGKDYAVVAIYSDAAHGEYLNQHVYLFTLHHGQPQVLVTEQNQGNPNGWLYFNPTQNRALQDGFASIVTSN